MKPFFTISLVAVFMTTALLFGGSCANIIPPQGGPRDTIPPRLLNAEPRDSTLNFREKKITLTFDEYVDLQDVQNNLLFTPLFQNNPRVDVKGKSININFKDTLERNTTYILNFGNAIKDFNEGNVLKNFTYTFSTGPRLDSLELKGKVILAQTGKTDSTLTVILHKNLKDSAVMNQRPLYATKLDANGNFHFHNLPSGTFAIYALGDAGISRRYQTKTQLFAFLDSPVTVGAHDSLLTLYAYRETQPTTPPASGLPARAPGKGENRLIFTTNLVNNQQDLNNDLVIRFTTPLRRFDSSRFILSTDSSFTPVSYTVKLDSTKKEISLHTSWKEATRYNLLLDRDFAMDTAGRRLLKTDTLNFMTRGPNDYGSISIRLRNIDLTRNPVLLFIQNEQVVYAASVKSGSFSASRFAPGDYELRILYDTNDNGKWDPGHFFGTKKQPELVHPIGDKITVKPAWDNSYER
ncbi:MAG: Ig-like domain-containing protein [Flavisolibacter sp.]